MIGGIASKEQRKRLDIDKPWVLVGTVGRLKELLRDQWCVYDAISLIVIDEADRFCYGYNK